MILPISPNKKSFLFPKLSLIKKEDTDLPVFPWLLVISHTTCTCKGEKFTNGALAVFLKTVPGVIVCAITWSQEIDPCTSTCLRVVITRFAIASSLLTLLSAVTLTDWSSNITIWLTEVSTNSGVKLCTGWAGLTSSGTSTLKYYACMAYYGVLLLPIVPTTIPTFYRKLV